MTNQEKRDQYLQGLIKAIEGLLDEGNSKESIIEELTKQPGWSPEQARSIVEDVLKKRKEQKNKARNSGCLLFGIILLIFGGGLLLSFYGFKLF